jgi:excisionase family DNA binding protein
MDEQTERLEDVEETAHRLNVRPSWIYLKVAQKEIPHIKVGKYLRFYPSRVDEWLAAKNSRHG